MHSNVLRSRLFDSESPRREIYRVNFWYRMNTGFAIGGLPLVALACTAPGRLLSIPFPPATFLSFTHHQLSFPSPQIIMSASPSTSTLQSNFVAIFNAALESYKRKTKKDLASHPLLPSLQSCDSPEAILTVLRDQIPAFSQSQNGDDGLTKWVVPTVNVLCAFSATLGQGVGIVNITIFSREEYLL